jgi:hypothetical protein
MYKVGVLGAGWFTRFAALGVALVMLAACTNGSQPRDRDGFATASPPTTTPSATPSPAKTLDTTAACEGFGRPKSTGEITFVSNNRLLAANADGATSRCLADLQAIDAPGVNTIPMRWNAPADRVILSNRALSADLAATKRLAARKGGFVQWSRPKGTSVIYVTRGGRIEKRSSFGGPATDISFLKRHDDVIYHPAGTHIATSGLAEDGSYGLYLATNIGTEPELLVTGEKARYLTNLQFSHDGRFLYYAAQHGSRNWHLHRLVMGDSPTLETLDKGDANFEYVTSAFDLGTVAWFEPGDCAAGRPGTLRLSGFGTNKIEIPAEFKHDDLLPLGWLPDRRLVVARRPISCSTAAPRAIYVLSGQEPVLIQQEDYGSASIRAKLPPPPPPPGGEQEVVA